jgi:hypothetical protein
MAPALFKRHKMSPECMLDQPVPLSYYNTANGDFHPRTIRQLINLKANKFVKDKRNDNIDVSVEEFEKFRVEFRETLFGMFDNNADIHQSDLDKEFELFSMEEDINEMQQREQNLIMGVDVPLEISEEPDWLVEAGKQQERERAIAANTLKQDRRAATKAANIAKKKAEEALLAAKAGAVAVIETAQMARLEAAREAARAVIEETSGRGITQFSEIDEAVMAIMVQEDIGRFERGEARVIPTEEQVAEMRARAEADISPSPQDILNRPPIEPLN